MAVEDSVLLAAAKKKFDDIDSVKTIKQLQMLATYDKEIQSWMVDFCIVAGFADEIPEYMKLAVKDPTIWGKVKDEIAGLSKERGIINARKKEAAANYRKETSRIEKDERELMSKAHALTVIHKMGVLNIPREYQVRISAINCDESINTEKAQKDAKDAVLMEYKKIVLKVWSEDGDWKSMVK
jgi:hypothetical protein